MVRARRLASIAAVAMLGVGVLTGCGRSDPAVAAYVASTEITEARLARIVDEYVGTAPEEQQAALRASDVKDRVLHLLVLEQVASDYTEANDIKVEAPNLEEFAQQQGLPPELELTEVLAGYSAALNALQAAVEPVAPTEDDRREAYENTLVQGQPLDQPYDEVKQYFNEETLGRSLGLREALDTAIAEANVTINPRYNAIYELPVQIENSARSWFGVQLGGSVPVSDVEVPSAVAPTEGTSGQG
jgi:hypothetical protein